MFASRSNSNTGDILPFQGRQRRHDVSQAVRTCSAVSAQSNPTNSTLVTSDRKRGCVDMTELRQQPHPLTPELLMQKFLLRGSLKAARPASPLTFLKDTLSLRIRCTKCVRQKHTQILTWINNWKSTMQCNHKPKLQYIKLN